jgi:dihydrofolate reductase
MRNINIIVAATIDGKIGNKGDLLFHISPDLRRFKQLTTGNTVIMGRKTFESLPKGALPNRRNIIVTRQADYHAAGAETANSLDEAIALAADKNAMGETFIIGGGEIYRQALPIATHIYITVVDKIYDEADTVFPDINDNEWTVTELSEELIDEKTSLPYFFKTMCRNSLLESNISM